MYNQAHTRRKTHSTKFKINKHTRGRPQTEFARSSPSVGQVHLVMECSGPNKFKPYGIYLQCSNEQVL